MTIFFTFPSQNLQERRFLKNAKKRLKSTVEKIWGKTNLMAKLKKNHLSHYFFRLKFGGISYQASISKRNSNQRMFVVGQMTKHFETLPGTPDPEMSKKE